jgi:hypothetical protein
MFYLVYVYMSTRYWKSGIRGALCIVPNVFISPASVSLPHRMHTAVSNKNVLRAADGSVLFCRMTFTISIGLQINHMSSMM